MAARVRAKIPESVTVGEVFTIRTLVSHRMESGLREHADGRLVPRDIINRFEATFEGERVFAVDIEPGIAANPFLEFTARIEKAGTLVLSWTDDAGEVTTYTQGIALA